MGKVGGTSWITAVKKVFRSPTKSSPKKNCKRREEYSQEDDEERKKTEKRRWIFRKFANHNQQYEASYEKKIDVDERNHAIAAAEAKTAAAKVAVATAQAAVRYQEIIPAYLAREYYAALIIQTAFRGYLARRALRALKGIVKLQALIRGSNIRKQAKATLKCMQTLIRVQSKLRDQSFARPLSHGLIRKSMYAESNNLWDKYKDIHHRKSVSRDENNSIDDQCKFQSYSIEDIEAMLQSRKEASLNREQALAYALSEQIRRFDRKISSTDDQIQNNDTEWLSQWLDSKEFNENNNTLTTPTTVVTKNVDMASLHHPNTRTPRSSRPLNNARPMTPPLLHDTRPVQAQSASPRACRAHSAATTPTLRSSSRTCAAMPNYMAATESAKARARTQSTPRQRHSVSDRSERGGSGTVKKRLSFPIPEHQYAGKVYADYSGLCQNLRSPSFRSVQEGVYYCHERGTTTCSSYTDITGDVVSPASTTQLRRWLS